jgi:fibronectin type 3 domain-containing protein
MLEISVLFLLKSLQRYAAADTTPPGQVAGLAVTTASSTQLNLAWTQNTESDLNHYNVYRGTTAGFAVTLGTTTPLATPTANSYQNTSLSPSTTYYYKVSAVDNAGNIGPLSAERSGTTNASSDTTIPSVTITSPANNASLAPGSILVQGTSSDNPGGSGIFDVQVRTDNNPWFIATPQSAGNWSTWSITVQLSTVGQHFIQARATDKANNMMWYDAFVNIT